MADRTLDRSPTAVSATVLDEILSLQKYDWKMAAREARADGHAIPENDDAERAFAIRRLLDFFLLYGEHWRLAAARAAHARAFKRRHGE
jgi:hypothetical protein